MNTIHPDTHPYITASEYAQLTAASRRAMMAMAETLRLQEAQLQRLIAPPPVDTDSDTELEQFANVLARIRNGLAEADGRAAGLSGEEIEAAAEHLPPGALAQQNADPDGPVSCPITSEPIPDDGSAMRISACGHTFHADALTRWLQHHDSCPVCRQRLVDRPPRRGQHVVTIRLPSPG